MTEKKEYPVLETKWGSAKVNNNGYYQIKTRKEGNHGKYLHVLIWEEYHGCKKPIDCDIHHIDGIKTNNQISNLKCMQKSEHSRFHNSFEKSNGVKKNTTGFLNVTKHQDKTCRQNFMYRYRTKINGGDKSFLAVDLYKLEMKVLGAGLPWEIIDMEKAKKTVEFEVDKFLGRAEFQ